MVIVANTTNTKRLLSMDNQSSIDCACIYLLSVKHKMLVNFSQSLALSSLMR